MSLITLQHPVREISGKVTGGPSATPSGLVYYPVSGRQFARSMFQPDNPQTAYQMAVRQAMAAAADAFQDLERPAVENWQALAAQILKKGRLQLDYSLNAIGLFCSVNVTRQLNGQPISATVPALVRPVPFACIGLKLNPDTSLAIHCGTDSFPAGIYQVRISSKLPGNARVARRNELRIPTKSAADSFKTIPVAAVTNPLLNIDLDDLKLDDFTEGARYGVEIRSWSLGYCPGYSAFTPSVAVELAS